MRTKIQKVEDDKVDFRAATRKLILSAHSHIEFSIENLICEPLYCIGSLRSRIKLLLALTMAYVFPRWAVKAELNKKA